MSDLQANVSRMEEDFQKAYAEMVKQEKARRDVFVADQKKIIADLQANVSRMEEDFQKAYAEMVKKEKAKSERHRSDQKKSVSDIKTNLYQMEERFYNALVEVASKERSKREALISEIKKEVAELGREIAELRQGIAADTKDSHRVWHDISSSEKTVMSVAKGKSYKKKKEDQMPGTDDFTKIPGIGSAMQRHLQEMGIYIFAQLAQSNPDDLSRGLGRFARIANTENWIQEAKKLVKGA